MSDETDGLAPAQARPDGAGPAAAEPALSARGITVRYGGVTAVADVSLTVPPACIVGVIGPNGAGKSTLLGAISGFIRPAAGSVYLDGADITRLPPEQRARLGLSRTFQRPELFTEMTVRDHLVVAQRVGHRRRPAALADGSGQPTSQEADRVQALLRLLGLTGYATLPVRGLPLGITRLVEVGRALATKPRVLLADEPFSGLNRNETDRVAAALTEVVTGEGVSIVLVEHDVEKVLELSHEVHLLDFGTTVTQGPPAAVRVNPRFRSAYLGQETAGEAASAASGTPAGGTATDRAATQAAGAENRAAVCEHAQDSTGKADPVLRVRDLRVAYGVAEAVAGISLDVPAGSAVAVLGANGAGKSSLCRALAGLVPVQGGTVRFAGSQVDKLPAHTIRRMGLVYLPEERGIFPRLTVAENIKMAVQALPRGERTAAAERAMTFFPPLAKRRGQVASTLSGGEQQMLSLARALATSPKLILADELSLGLAPRVIDAVFEGLASALASGVSLMVIEQFAARALAFCDSAYILRRGTVAWHGDARAAGTAVARQYLGAA
jgi:ABC-type branched-subunit amino acid transport system ATPase component